MTEALCFTVTVTGLGLCMEEDAGGGGEEEGEEEDENDDGIYVYTDKGSVDMAWQRGGAAIE
jgi:hypothetical protein